MRFWIAFCASALAAGCGATAELRELEEFSARSAEGPAEDHPRAREARLRAEAALARARGAAALDDPMLFLRAEGVPLRTPGSFRQDEWNAAGVSQTVPLFKLGPREEAAAAEARRLREDYLHARLEIAAERRRVTAEHFEAAREVEIRARHREILAAMAEAAEAKYRAGRAPQQDALQARLEEAEAEALRAQAEARRREARAAWKDLTGRDEEPPEPRPPAELPALESLLAAAIERHPSLRARRAAVRRAEAARALAARERWVPDLSFDLMVMQMPDAPDAWGGTVGFTLPWFSPRRRAEEEAAERELEAERRALEAEERAVRRGLEAAHARLRAALERRALYEETLLPRARQALEGARSNYEQDRIDFLRLLEAERALRSAELERARAAAQAESAWADLERAAGGAIGGGTP
jgi:outer membrane protein TolC